MTWGDAWNFESGLFLHEQCGVQGIVSWHTNTSQARQRERERAANVRRCWKIHPSCAWHMPVIANFHLLKLPEPRQTKKKLSAEVIPESPEAWRVLQNIHGGRSFNSHSDTEIHYTKLNLMMALERGRKFHVHTVTIIWKSWISSHFSMRSRHLKIRWSKISIMWCAWIYCSALVVDRPRSCLQRQRSFPWHRWGRSFTWMSLLGEQKTS